MTTLDSTKNANDYLLNVILEDKKKTRRAGYFKFTVAAAIALLYVGVIYKGVNQDARPDVPYAAVVSISGEIGPGKAASIEQVGPLLNEAFADKAATGVVLRINSPGGTPVQSALIHDRIVALKKQYNKKVIAVGEDMVTSGAYMIAVGADKIYVNRSTLAGSIGVISRSFGFTGAMEKLGVERRVMTAGESKNLLDPFGPQSEADKEKQAELLHAIHNHFKDVVKAGRGARLKADYPGLFSGTVWTGETAAAMGLVDGLSDLKSVAESELGAKRTYEYKPPQSIISALTGGAGLKMAVELSPTMSGTGIQAVTP